MAAANPSVRLWGLARRLVMDGLLNESDAQAAYEASQKKRIPFVSYLVENNVLDGRSIALSAAHEFGAPLFDLSVYDSSSLPKDLLGNDKLIRRLHALPLIRRGNRLFVAISDPTNQQALDELKFSSGLITDPVLVEEQKLSPLIEQALEAEDSSSMGDLLGDDDLENLEVTGVDEEAPTDVQDSDVDDAPVVRFVNKVLLDAVKRKASDIHFEPYEKSFRVRYREDGILEEIASPPVTLGPRIVSRIKVMSRMDVSERRIPQDGRIKMHLSKNRSIDFRVNTCPTLYGEKVVCRILDAAAAKLGIDALGYEEEQKQIYRDALSKPQGLILVTGPTGSGKTVSLYTGLNILNTEGRNISTAEDPAEIVVPGINQVNINTKVGLTFADALRAFLRQDPDVIMVGEIRDLETAEIAIKAAQTGHLVLSTLHTNDAPQTLSRLAQMGVPHYNIATAVSIIIAQRLGRKLCDKCKEPMEVPPESLLEAGFREDELEGLTLYRPIGCDRCNKGYKGRVGIFQVIKLSEDMGRIIMEGGNAIELADQARKEGFNDLRRSGLNKVKQGLTSLEEVLRVTSD